MTAPMPNFKQAAEPSLKELAALCVGGKPEAGVELVRRLWARGEDVTIVKLVETAVPTMHPTAQAFDNLADALARAMRGPGAPA